MKAPYAFPPCMMSTHCSRRAARSRTSTTFVSIARFGADLLGPVRPLLVRAVEDVGDVAQRPELRRAVLRVEQVDGDGGVSGRRRGGRRAAAITSQSSRPAKCATSCAPMMPVPPTIRAVFFIVRS